MSKVAEIQSAVGQLSREELSAFRTWFADQELEEDVAAGKLDKLAEEALRSKKTPWDEVNAFRDRLAASGRNFGDSAELIHEDRDR